MDKLSEQLADNDGSLQTEQNAHSRVLTTSFKGLTLASINQLTRFTPLELSQLSGIRLFKNFPSNYAVVPVFNSIDIPRISYPVIGSFMGYLLWLFQIALVYTSVKFFNKRINLIKTVFFMFMYINTALLQSLNIGSKLIMYDFFSYFMYGYYGHWFNILPLLFSKNNFLVKMYDFDKIYLS
jgi:hypothetical protein